MNHSKSMYLADITAVFALCHCSEVTYPFRRGASTSLTHERIPVQDAERKYIAQRRAAAEVSGSAPRLGIAFSGGGIRSATLNLGTLQALEKQGLLKQADYLSCVSGGGYIGSWYVSHLRTEKEMNDLRTQISNDRSISARERQEALAACASSRSKLLALESPDCHSLKGTALEHMEAYGGLFGKKWNKAWQITMSAGHWLVTTPVNVVQDVALHLKPLPGKWNMTHPIFRYRRNLEYYYYKGWPHRPATLAEDINSEGSQTPYFISCAALGNQDLSKGDYTRNSHFEFASRHCGSAMTGWIDTHQFNKAVKSVNEDASSSGILKGGYPGMETKPFRISTAVAASGAAVDASGLRNKPALAVVADNLLTLFNFNLRLLAPNAGQDRTGVVGRVFDRAREVTTDRIQYGQHSNTTLITDGGHFENLGVYALALREVPWILAFDCGQDGSYEFADLRRLEKLLHEAGYDMKWNGDSPDGYEAWKRYEEDKTKSVKKPVTQLPDHATYEFTISRGGKATSRVIYTKACVPTDKKARENFSQQCLWEEYAKGRTTEFPHINTLRIAAWDEGRFNAYRGIGFDLADHAARLAKKKMGTR